MSNPSPLKTLLEEKASLMRQINPNRDWKYGGFEELVLDCGLEMEASPLPRGIKLGLLNRVIGTAKS